MYQDTNAKHTIEAECEKRNAHMGKSLRKTKAWKPIWNPTKGWHPELRHV